MKPFHEKDLKRTAAELKAAALPAVVAGSSAPTARNAQSGRDAALGRDQEQEKLAHEIERRLVCAAWTLRRMPDKERGFLRMRTSIWAETKAAPGDYAPESEGYLASRKRGRIGAAEIDAMQPALDLLTLLPDITDRKILFWAAWHQDGELQARIPWAKVRRSLDAAASRWTLKRRYQAGLLWLAALVALQR
jgi:hypothetical protein